MKTQKGFTLVEILIVVVILGILAAIVIPQFTDASSQANASRVETDLQTLRSQVELYKIQHNDNVPDTTSGTTFALGLTSKTDFDGTVNASGAYGPYMQVIPTNPYNSLNTIRLDGAAAPAETAGWRFDTTTGFLASDANSV